MFQQVQRLTFTENKNDDSCKARVGNTLPKQKCILYRIWRNPLLMPYNRLAVFIVLINIYYFFIHAKNISVFNHGLDLSQVLNIVIINFTIAITIRQQQVINFLFKIATSFSTKLPLSFRWGCGKVYHFGGIHVGSYFSGSVWLFLLNGMLLKMKLAKGFDALFWLTFCHSLILLSIMTISLPKLRAKYHNTFEVVTRFGNWVSLLMFWVEIIIFLQLINKSELTLQKLITSPYVLTLVYLTFLTILPWLRLKKVPVSIKTPSSHVAIANFDYGVTPFEGSSTELSRNPFLEWHAFANVPKPKEKGFDLTISRAGDWTGELIDQIPEFLWVKGIPTAGVGNIEKLFKKVIWVATGSGIGPCLPHLLTKKVPSRLVWATRNPRKTYGEDLVDEILEVQPQACIWNTDEHGKPDLVDLAFQAYRDFDAEAIICISNKKLTWKLVYEFESRGIPAFGAIWDS